MKSFGREGGALFVIASVVEKDVCANSRSALSVKSSLFESGSLQFPSSDGSSTREYWRFPPRHVNY